MYKLYGSPKTRAGRVMWLLEELGVDYELIPSDPHAPEVFALNPNGKIPILVDRDRVVTDSSAILFHLADKHGAFTFPLGAPERAAMTSMIFFALDELEQPLWTFTKHKFILPREIRSREAVTPACHHDFAAGLKTLGKYLGGRDFAAGDRFTIADIVIGHLGGWAKANRFPEPEGAVADYMGRVRGRPAWRRVVEAREAA